MAMTMAMTMTMTMESIAGTLAWGEQRLRHAECSARVPGGPVLRQSGRLRACRRLGPSRRIREYEGAKQREFAFKKLVGPTSDRKGTAGAKPGYNNAA